MDGGSKDRWKRRYTIDGNELAQLIRKHGVQNGGGMAQYPVHIHVKPYRGAKQIEKLRYQQRIEAANTIEAYLNEQMKNQEIEMFTYYDIAEATHLTVETVHEILVRFDGGSNGITIRNNTKKAAPEEGGDAT